MKTHEIAPDTMLGLGLDPVEQKEIARLAPPDVQLVCHDASSLLSAFPSDRELEAMDPFIVWITWSVWHNLPRHRRESLLAQCRGTVVLILEGELESVELAANLDHRLSVLRPPLNRRTLLGLLETALETRRLYQDIYHMTQEILLEREMLQRKNEYLGFINRFLTRVTESLNPADILNTARNELPKLLPVQLLHACFWDSSTPDLEANLALSRGLSPEARDAWIELLLTHVGRLGAREAHQYRIIELRGVASEPPAEHRLLLVPLRYGEETFGCLALQGQEEFRLSHDQVDLLNATTSHLALALKNALLFSTLKNQADFDGLTRVHNRRHFDDRLPRELGRHQLSGADMSLLLIDLDHFKRINDEFGHQMGDAVLRQVGRIIRDQVRTTDYAARYGGEEFVVLLPECSKTQAWLLAERLRQAIARSSYQSEGRECRVTASIGVASLSQDDQEGLGDELGILGQADKCLYMAKKQGRNKVFCLDNPNDTPLDDAAQA